MSARGSSACELFACSTRRRDRSNPRFSIVGFRNRSILLDPRGDPRGEHRFCKGSVAKQSLPSSSKRVRFDYAGFRDVFFPFRLSKNKARDVLLRLYFSCFFFLILFSEARVENISRHTRCRDVKRRRGVPINSDPCLLANAWYIRPCVPL